MSKKALLLFGFLVAPVCMSFAGEIAVKEEVPAAIEEEVIADAEEVIADAEEVIAKVEE